MASDNPFAGRPCTKCGAHRLRLELREELVVRPLGSYSLAGAQTKAAAVMVRWPWCVCDGCGAECRGKRAEEAP